MTYRDLLPSEVVFVAAMQQLCFGRLEHLRIRRGELVLDPWPTTIREVKFATTVNTGKVEVGAAELRAQIAEFFEYVRGGDGTESVPSKSGMVCLSRWKLKQSAPV